MNTQNLKARFDDLTVNEQRREYASFLDMVDQGGAGWHPYYLVLVERYAAGDGVNEVEWLAETTAEIDHTTAAAWMVDSLAMDAEYGRPVF